ncbi:unnamed protein product, partial [Durusdinium trenchii]
ESSAKNRAAALAQLRRICMPKPGSHQLDAPKGVHKKYQQRGKSREELLTLLRECGLNKEKFVKTVTKRFKRTRKGSFKVKAGFYTEQAMKDTLNYNPKRIAAIVKYCSHKSRRADHRQLDKYEKGVYKYWVEEDMNAEFEEAEEEESVEESTRTSADRMRRVKAKMTLTCPLGKPSGNEDDSDQESESPSDIDNK